MPRGGKRKGSGRKKRGGGSRQVSHRTTHDEAALYDEEAARVGMASRSDWIHAQCQRGLDLARVGADSTDDAEKADGTHV